MSEIAGKLYQTGALEQLAQAVTEGKLSSAARQNIEKWLKETRYRKFQAAVIEHIEQAKWKQLDDAFWTVIPFGTGGRRGRMYPIGSNTINDRTIGESAAGLAEYVRQTGSAKGELSCAIAYDTRHNSRVYAELCARIMVANGFRVYFLDGFRSTPELSFLVRFKHCDCGIMVTASHNPPSDNAVKVYWSTGGQILPPHDQDIIDRVMEVGDIDEGVAFERSVSDGRILLCQAEVDTAFVNAVVTLGIKGPRDLKILYSPLHGVGASAVCPVLAADGFQDVETFAPHSEPNGDFPNVPNHVSNPENPAVFASMIERAQQTRAEVVLATDPDCDRLGVAAPLTLSPGSDWKTLTGNQIGALLTDFVLQTTPVSQRTSKHFLVKTLVTTEMIRRIGDSYGVLTYGNLLVGFKWIGGVIDDVDPDKFLLGCEESHGYLAGQYARDKDGALAAMLLSELAARTKSEGRSLHQQLDLLYLKYGYHAELLHTETMEGSAGMEQMKTLMQRFRQQPPAELAGLKVAGVRDYLNGTIMRPDGTTEPLEGPTGNMVFVDLADPGNGIAVRPSGTEPKVKFYMFAYVRPDPSAELELDKARIAEWLDQLKSDLVKFAAKAG